MKSPEMRDFRRIAKTLLIWSVGMSAAIVPGLAMAASCPWCGWTPPVTAVNLVVRSTSGLAAALRQAIPGTTLLLEDGVYRLEEMLDIPVPDVVLRGKSGIRSRVVIHGEGMAERRVGVALSVSAPRVVLADLTVASVGYHGIQVRGEREAHRVVIHNVRVVDTGQQLLKESLSPDGKSADEGLVACCSFEYSDHAPSDYTNGVDVLGGKGWVVRGNRFLRIRGPREQGWHAGPAILFWRGSEGTRVEGNLVLDCFRGIALGLGSGFAGPPADGGGGFDHRGGIIVRNLVCNLNRWADEGIEANGAPGIRIEHNTVLVEGELPWSISVRFAATNARVRNNLTNRGIQLREGGRAELAGNVTDALRDWFVDPAGGDLRLRQGDVAAIDAGVPTPDPFRARDRGPTFLGKAPDAGAFEYSGEKGGSSGRERSTPSEDASRR